jgi:hypothetical protein
MNEIILNCLTISLSISMSNLIVQYIIEVYIRKSTFVTLAEYNTKIAVIETQLQTCLSNEYWMYENV